MHEKVVRHTQNNAASVNVTDPKCPMQGLHKDKCSVIPLLEHEESSSSKTSIFKLSYLLLCLIDHLLSLTCVVRGDFIFLPLSEVI